MTKSRKARLKKIETAKLELEERLLRLRSMFDPHGDKGPYDEWKQAGEGFAFLYYLYQLARKAK